jgi:hypothetical protein
VKCQPTEWQSGRPRGSSNHKTDLWLFSCHTLDGSAQFCFSKILSMFLKNLNVFQSPASLVQPVSYFLHIDVGNEYVMNS